MRSPVRCELLRASKDEPQAVPNHPSRLAEEGEHLRMTAVDMADMNVADPT